MITFRCGRCAQPVQASETLAGRAVTCQRCGHVNVCPPPTVSFPPPRPTAPAPPARASFSISPRGIGIAAGVLLFGVTIWMAWSQLEGSGATAAKTPASPAEALQQQLLEQNLGAPGDPALDEMYRDLNAKHFSGKLPSLHVVWEPGLAKVGPASGQDFTLEGMFGHRGKRAVILLNPEVKDDSAALNRALCHEAVHAFLFATGDQGPEHGPAFQAMLKNLAAEGAFEGIVSTDEERTTLRAWLDEESKRLDDESKYMEGVGKDIERQRADVEQAIADLNAKPEDSTGAKAALIEKLRTEYNERAIDANARNEQDRADFEHFNQEVARYNLMLVYPDGLDQSSRLSPKVAPPRPGGGQ